MRPYVPVVGENEEPNKTYFLRRMDTYRRFISGGGCIGKIDQDKQKNQSMSPSP